MINMINVGERRIDAQHRILLGKGICEAYDLRPGDRVEILMHKVRS